MSAVDIMVLIKCYTKFKCHTNFISSVDLSSLKEQLLGIKLNKHNHSYMYINHKHENIREGFSLKQIQSSLLMTCLVTEAMLLMSLEW